MAGLLGFNPVTLGGLLGASPNPQSASPQPQTDPDPYKPSFGDYVAGWFRGELPDEAGMNARSRKMALAQQAMQIRQAQEIWPTLTPDQKVAFLTNQPELGKALASRSEAANVPQGDTRFMGEGGPSGFTAPKIITDDKSGVIGSATPAGFTPFGQFGGDFNGISGLSSRTGVQVPVAAFNKVSPGERGSYTAPPLPGLSMGPSGAPQLNGVAGFAPALPQGVPGQPPIPSTRTMGGAMGAPPPAAGVLPPLAAPQTMTVGGAGGAPPVAGRGSNAPAQPNGLDPQAFFRSFILPHEGGLNPSDMNGSPTMYGFNQAANPDIDVKSLTPDAAAQRFAAKYYGPSGAANLPAPLAAVHADTYFINPAKAQQFLQQSGGDPARYMDLREAWMKGMLQSNPKAAPYANAWAQRNAALRQFAGQGDAQPAVGSTQAGAPQGQGAFGLPSALDNTGSDRIVTADQVPNGKPGWTYKVSPRGEITPIPPEFTMDHVLSNRAKFYSSEQYKDATNAVAPLQALYNTVNDVAPGGVVGMAALDTINKNFNPGGVVRPQTAQMFLEHLGLPEEAKSFILQKVGNTFLSPKVITDIGRAGWLYTKAHVDQAARLQQSDTELATRNGYKPEDVGEAVPQMPDVPKWAQDALPPPNKRVVGKVYWSPKGPAKWTTKGWVLQ